MKNKNKYGQYFTIESIADFMVGLITHNKSARILEPSCGQGVFLKELEKSGFKNISAYEIDDNLSKDFKYVIHSSFISSPIKPYEVVIGNPPYIRWKNLEDELKDELSHSPLWNKYFNSLCDYLFIFILKSIEQLVDAGELIFICTEYWLNTTNSQTLRDYMTKHGYISDIYHFKEAPLFESVSASFIIFRFVKSQSKQDTIHLYRYNQMGVPSVSDLKTKTCFDEVDIPQFEIGSRWLLATESQQKLLSTFESACTIFGNDLFSSPKIRKIGDVCDIGNGMVSGLDKAFNVSKLELNKCETECVINVLKAKDLDYYNYNSESKYFFVQKSISKDEFEKSYPNVYKHMEPYVSDLVKRYDYGKSPNYWEFVFPRNFKLFSRKESRIFVPCKERTSNKEHFRFVLAPDNYYPLQDVTAIFKKPCCKESIEYLLAYLNNERVFEWLSFNGIVKGYIVEFSEAPIASIPYRAINWDNKKEVAIHNNIVKEVRSYIADRDNQHVLNINKLFNQLFL